MTAERPDVTVGIVSWNAADDLRRCLDALPAGLEGLRAQVVVVDNGSRDGTAGVLAGHPTVETIRNHRNVGLTPGRNQILARARGRHVLMLDADTVPLPGAIRTLTEYLDAHPEVGLVGAKLLDPDGSLQLSCRTFPPALLPFLRRPPLAAVFEHRRTVNRHLLRGYDHAAPRAVDWVMGACQCYRADLLPIIGRYDERIFSHGGEDTDWCVRVWKAGREVHYIPDARVVHAYGHFTRRNPLSKQALRGFVDYFYMQAKHRRARGGFTSPA
jgi:N-acetylglucosaminyl-diphospho-decaprenol L-rhamnosyltransferase